MPVVHRLTEATSVDSLPVLPGGLHARDLPSLPALGPTSGSTPGPTSYTSSARSQILGLPQLQRIPGGPLPTEQSPSPAPARLPDVPLGIAANPGAAAIASGAAHADGQGSVVFVQAAGEGSDHPASDHPASAGTVDPNADPVPVQTAASAVMTAGTAAQGPAHGAENALPTDLDELARRLFDPLSARLKNELWMDRERAGMITDLRR